MTRSVMAVGWMAGVLFLLSLTGCGPDESPAPPPAATPPPVALPPPSPPPVAAPPAVSEVAPPQDLGVQGTPRGLIEAFFAAAATNGTALLAELSMPRVQEKIKDPEWVQLWSDYKVTEVGAKTLEIVPPREGAKRTMRVPVVTEHRESGEVLKEMYGVSQKEDHRWYWDEL